jgi:hypothetical protein
MIEEDERVRLGSRVPVRFEWRDFLNPIENYPLNLEEIRYIAQEFGGMMVDLNLFMIEGPITV